MLNVPSLSRPPFAYSGTATNFELYGSLATITRVQRTLFASWSSPRRPASTPSSSKYRSPAHGLTRHMTSIFFSLLFHSDISQVRGHATVHYESKLEPWSETYGWKPPGFDPLHLAITAAHDRHLAIHAWMNGTATSVLMFLCSCSVAVMPRHLLPLLPRSDAHVAWPAPASRGHPALQCPARLELVRRQWKSPGT